jgi:phosphoglycerate kinase
MLKPKRPLVVILGGAKAETKIPVIEHFLSKANYILVSGGVFNTYLLAKGYKVGCSIVDPEYKKAILKYAKTGKLIFPVDMVVGKLDGSEAELVPFTKKFAVKNKQKAICDIGPATIQLFTEFIKKAQTLIWNGAMGKFEVHPYEYGTYSLTHLFAARSKGKAFGVCGGGETVQVFQKLGVAEQVDLVSTGGGAMLEFLSGKKLPGIAALHAK